MKERLRSNLPTLIGASVLILMMDGLILLLSSLGLSKGTAIYLAVVIFTAFLASITRLYFRHNRERNENHG